MPRLPGGLRIKQASQCGVVMQATLTLYLNIAHGILDEGLAGGVEPLLTPLLCGRFPLAIGLLCELRTQQCLLSRGRECFPCHSRVCHVVSQMSAMLVFIGGSQLIEAGAEGLDELRGSCMVVGVQSLSQGAVCSESLQQSRRGRNGINVGSRQQ